MPATTFEACRPKLFGIAYRMLGEISTAEDIVQDAYLRWHHSERGNIDNPEAFLVTVTTRLCIDHLKSAKVSRESYIGPWLPEPLIAANDEPEMAQALADTLSYGWLMLLERLDPVERAVFILREAFDYKHQEIADILGKSEANSRQLARRAKQHIQQDDRRSDGVDDRDKLFGEFLQACATGDMDQLFDLLADDITVYSDGGGKVRAALRPLQGKERVMRFLKRLFQNMDDSSDVRLCRINGQPGLSIYEDGKLTATTTMEFENGKVKQLYSVRNPDKLSCISSDLSLI